MNIKQKWQMLKGQKLLKKLELKFGKYKKIILTTTGKAYKVPLKDILMIGVKGIDLPKYPEWEND
jgi:hypothetical protein